MKIRIRKTTTALDRFPAGTRVHDIGVRAGTGLGGNPSGTTSEGTVVCSGGDWGTDRVMVRFDIDDANPPAPSDLMDAAGLIPMDPANLGRL